MPTIREEATLDVSAASAWDALRRVGDAHKLFAPVLSGCELDGDTRTARFANGMVVHERILDVDDDQRRVAYTVLDGPGMTYHHASMEIVEDGDGRCRFVWITDFLPEEIRGNLLPLVQQGTQAVKKNLR